MHLDLVRKIYTADLEVKKTFDHLTNEFTNDHFIASDEALKAYETALVNRHQYNQLIDDQDV